MTLGYCNYIINFYETEMATPRLKQLLIFAVNLTSYSIFLFFNNIYIYSILCLLVTKPNIVLVYRYNDNNVAIPLAVLNGI